MTTAAEFEQQIAVLQVRIAQIDAERLSIKNMLLPSLRAAKREAREAEAREAARVAGRQTARGIDQHRRERLAMVTSYVASGKSCREVAELFNVSHGRAHQLIKQATELQSMRECHALAMKSYALSRFAMSHAHATHEASTACDT